MSVFLSLSPSYCVSTPSLSWVYLYHHSRRFSSSFRSTSLDFLPSQTLVIGCNRSQTDCFKPNNLGKKTDSPGYQLFKSPKIFQKAFQFVNQQTQSVSKKLSYNLFDELEDRPTAVLGAGGISSVGSSSSIGSSSSSGSNSGGNLLSNSNLLAATAKSNPQQITHSSLFSGFKKSQYSAWNAKTASSQQQTQLNKENSTEGLPGVALANSFAPKFTTNSSQGALNTQNSNNSFHLHAHNSSFQMALDQSLFDSSSSTPSDSEALHSKLQLRQTGSRPAPQTPQQQPQQFPYSFFQDGAQSAKPKEDPHYSFNALRLTPQSKQPQSQTFKENISTPLNQFQNEYQLKIRNLKKELMGTPDTKLLDAE